MFNRHDLKRNEYMLKGRLARKGYDWWWHSFTARNERTGEERPFFIEFFTCNPKRAEEEPVFGQLEENKAKKKKPSYLMVKVGTWGKNACQLHRFFSLNDVDIIGEAPFSVTADNCYCSDIFTRGTVSVSKEDSENHPEYMCDYGEIKWNLTIEKEVAFNVGYGASTFFRKINAFEMFWHAEGMKSKFEGTISFNGEKYIVTPETCFGYSDKNWGKGFTTPWVWLSSNCLTSKLTGKVLENSVFDIGGGKPKIYFLPLNRKLLGAFWYEGKEYEFNFSKFWTGCKTKFDFYETEADVIWQVVQETKTAKMETQILCKKKDMLHINYESPDGKKRHNNLWNGGNGIGNIKLYEKKDKELVLIDEIYATHIGCEYGEYDK